MSETYSPKQPSLHVPSAISYHQVKDILKQPPLPMEGKGYI